MAKTMKIVVELEVPKMKTEWEAITWFVKFSEANVSEGLADGIKVAGWPFKK